MIEVANGPMVRNNIQEGRITLLSETDIHGTITFVNDYFCELSKYTREELLGRPHNIIRHPDMPKELFTAIWHTIKNGEVFRGIIKNMAKDGSHYWVNATIMPILNADNKIIKYVGARYYIPDEVLARQLFDSQNQFLPDR